MDKRPDVEGIVSQYQTDLLAYPLNCVWSARQDARCYSLDKTKTDVEALHAWITDLEARDRWISVGEGLPEEQHNVWASILQPTNCAQPRVDKAHVFQGEWYESDGSKLLYVVTHWREIPEGPVK